MHSKCMVKLVSVKQICRICVYQIFLMHRFNVWFQFHTWSFITSIWMLSMEVTTSVVYPPNWNVFPQWSDTSKGNRLKCHPQHKLVQTTAHRRNAGLFCLCSSHDIPIISWQATLYLVDPARGCAGSSTYIWDIGRIHRRRRRRSGVWLRCCCSGSPCWRPPSPRRTRWLCSWRGKGRV